MLPAHTTTIRHLYHGEPLPVPPPLHPPAPEPVLFAGRPVCVEQASRAVKFLRACGDCSLEVVSINLDLDRDTTYHLLRYLEVVTKQVQERKLDGYWLWSAVSA